MTAETLLPHIDEHAVGIGAGVECTWTALLDVIAATFTGRGAAGYARIVGCADSAKPPTLLVEGSTVRGFVVTRLVVDQVLELSGQHRYAEYRLSFHLDRIGPARTRLSARTDARFPGSFGAIYRQLVIGTRFHMLVVRRMLRQVERRAVTSGLPDRSSRSSDGANLTGTTA